MGCHGVGSEQSINDYLPSEDEEGHHEQNLLKRKPDQAVIEPPSKEVEVATAGQSNGA